MALINAQVAKITGQAITYAAATAGPGDTLKPSPRGVLHVRNGGGAPINATIVVPGNTQWGQAQPDVTVAVPAGGEIAFGPFPDELADNSGLISVTYTGVTSVTVALVTT